MDGRAYRLRVAPLLKSFGRVLEMGPALTRLAEDRGGAELRPMRLGTGEILLILAAALLIFGPTKLPQLGDALGRGIRSFRKATSGDAAGEGKALPAGKPEASEPRSGAGRS